MNPADALITSKLRRVAHDMAGKQAEELESTRLETTHAAMLMFGDQPAAERKKYIGRARKVCPRPYPRIGRGNHRALPA